MKNIIIPIASWAVSLFTVFVFLVSLPYKFTLHSDTKHIFGTIGMWISDTINMGLGEWFAAQGSYVIGAAELVTSIVLLMPAILWLLSSVKLTNAQPKRAYWHALGGLLASCIMVGAVFFHLFTPLGIEVLHNGVSDNGSLFTKAASIVVLAGIMAAANTMLVRAK